MKLILCFYLLFPFSSYAFIDLKKISQEFLKNNLDIKKEEQEVIKKEYSVDKFYSEYIPSLNVSNIYGNTDLEVSSSLFSGTTYLQNYKIGLVKRDFFGGRWTYDFSLVGTKRENNSFVTNSSQLWETSHDFGLSLDLTRDLFGQSSRLGEQIANEQLSIAKKRSRFLNERQFLDFWKKGIDAKLKKTLVEHNEQAKLRALERYKLIKRFVRDGLRDQVDLIQAKMNVTAQDQKVIQAQRELESALLKFSQLLHRRVTPNEIRVFQEDDSLTFFEKKHQYGIKNAELALINNELNTLDMEVEKAKRDSFPVVNLVTKYKTNAFDTEIGTSIGEGTSLNHGKDWSVGIEVSVPLGESVEENLYKMKKVDYRMKEFALRKKKKNLVLEKQRLTNNVRMSKLVLKLNIEQKDLAIDALKKMNRLYRLGRRDLDGLIRAEETLISAQIGIAQNISIYKKYIADLSYLEGKLLP